MSKDTTPSQPATSQWAIDPALQQISAATAGHTANQAYYGYPSYYYQQPQQAQPQATRASTPAVASTSTAAPKSAGGGALDSSDINTLSDAIGSAGIDLRAEEESLQKPHDSSISYRQYHSDRTHTQPQNLSFNSHFLGTTVRAIAADTHKLGKPISDDTVNYLALALRTRLQDLIKGMIAASHHRTDSAYDHATSLYEGTDIPMWDVTVRRDVAKQLAVLERIEKEDELKTRRDRKERADMAAAQLAALQASGSGSSSLGSYGGGGDMDDDMGENPKKKRKKDGPGVTAKNMSEDVRKQMSNLVANQAIGGKKYSWMTASNASAAPRSAKAPEKTASASSPATSTPRSTWSKPYVSATVKTGKDAGDAGTPTEEDTKTRVTMRDAMFVVEKERGHGGGRGAALGWT